MSAIKRTRLWEPLTLPTGAITKVYTAPEFVNTQIIVVNAYNNNSINVTKLRVMIVKAGAGVSYFTDTLYYDTLAQHQTGQYMQGMVLNSGDMLYALATGNEVAFNGFGIEITQGG